MEATKNSNASRYVVLDIENPNAKMNSICSIGIIYKNDSEVQEISSLINPEDRFDARNVEINGIKQHMVVGKPTFKEYWHQIEDLLTHNVIVGHNVVYDLRVIAGALDRYDMVVPTFHYVDTLLIAKRFLALDSYKLEALADYIGYSYHPHNAMDDARAAYHLLEYLSANFGVDASFIREYNYSAILREKIDQTLATNINKLYGIVRGINYDGIVNADEIAELKKWSEENQQYKQYAIFNKVLTVLDRVLEDGKIDEYERVELLTLVSSVNNSTIYTEATLNLQILHGILEGLICDDQLNIQEVSNLKKWLEVNDYLSGVYPYDKVFLIVNHVLEDKVLTESEKSDLCRTFQDILHPVTSTKQGIDLEGKTFCLTGGFELGDKESITKKLTEKGGIARTGVSRRLNYLFIGNHGSEAWKFGNVGGKIAKAQELNEKGANIVLVDENELKSILS